MSFIKSAAVTALVAAAALSSGMTAASAHGGKGKGLGIGKSLSFNSGKFNNNFRRKQVGIGTIVIGSSDFDCSYWFHRYKKTGNPLFLDRYYACIY